MADPLDVVARDTVGQFFGRDVKAAIATEREVRDAIEAIYHGSHAQEQRIRNLVGDVAYSAEPDMQAGGEQVDAPDLEGELATDKAPRQIDVRVSAIATIYGEKIVLRILDKDAVNHNLDSLGFEPHLLGDFKNAISQPHGVIVVTGPTGSGKSTTLYSALTYLRDPRKNITTIEDLLSHMVDTEGASDLILTKGRPLC